MYPDKQYTEAFIRHKATNDEVYWPLHDEHVLHHRSYNGIIEEVAREKGTWFLDNGRLLGGKREYFVDPIHYTPLGVKVLAGSYADYLAPRIATETNLAGESFEPVRGPYQ